jgi:uncharacterized protein (TIGR02001 family)
MVAWLRAIVNGAAVTLVSGALGSACAEGFSGAVGVTNDKVYRGFSQNRGSGSLMADLSYQHSGWAFGAGAATMHDNGRSTSSEVTLSLQRQWQLNDDWSTQLGGTGYVYPGSRDPRYRNYVELSASLDWRGRLSLTVLNAPQIGAVGRDRQPMRGRVVAYEAALHWPIAGRWSFDAGAGWNDARRIEATSYAYGSVGLSWGVGPVTLFASRVFSDADSRAGAPKAFVGDRTVLSAWVSF